MTGVYLPGVCRCARVLIPANVEIKEPLKEALNACCVVSTEGFVRLLLDIDRRC